jgi:N6-adenosine-specific RNA methylase IME4
MKGVRCSWAEMQRIRAMLADGERGTQAALERLRCVSPATVSKWKATCDVLQAIDGIVSISKLVKCQPSHAAVIGSAFRRTDKLPDDESVRQEIVQWVERCEDEKLTVKQLRQEVASLSVNGVNGESPANGCRVDDLNSLVREGKMFGTLYADPPWDYGNQGTRAATSRHYASLPAGWIAALPVAALAAERSHLHLWTTNAFLKEAIGLLEGWGFEFKSTFVWVKSQLGIGNYWRCSHEIMLLGVRGGLTFPPTDIKSWLECGRGKHSEKPEQVRELIERVSPAPRLELFGRVQRPGWTVWGDQVERDLFFNNGETASCQRQADVPPTTATGPSGSSENCSA